MNVMFKENEPAHLGYNVQRIREIIGMKQMELGFRCNGWSQQQISKLEQMQDIPEESLSVLAKGLGVTSDFIRNFREDKAIYNIQNNNDSATVTSQNYKNITNNDGKLAELFEKFINDDKKKTDLLESLTKIVAHLAEEVEKLKKV